MSPRSGGLLAAIVVGFGVFAVGCLSDVLLLASGGSPWLALVCDLSVGAFAGGLVLYYEWRRNADLHRKLGNVAEMNHHVRNQLEIIEYSAWATNDKAHIARMHDSVAHIAWALREILGDDYRDIDASPPAKPPASVRPAVKREDRDSID
jgi:hypothetical protein